MAGIGKAIKGLGLLAKKYKKAVTKKASSQMGWKKNLKERSRVFKEGQEKHKALDKQIESGVVDRNVKSKEMFKVMKGIKGKK